MADVLFPINDPKPQKPWLKKLMSQTTSKDPMMNLTPEQAKAELKKLAANDFEAPVDNAFGAPPAPAKPGLKAPLLPPELREEDPNAPDATVPVSKADLQQLQELVGRLTKGASGPPQNPDEMQMAKSDTMTSDNAPADDVPGNEESSDQESPEEDQSDPNEQDQQAAGDSQSAAPADDATADDNLTDEQYLAKYFKHKMPK